MLHQTFSISYGIPVLLCRQERWETLALSGLPISQWTYSQKCIPLTFDYRIIGQTERSTMIYQIGSSMGIQQCLYLRRRPMESSFQNEQRTLWTNGDVLWIVQFTSNIPSDDGRHLWRHDQWMYYHCIYGRYFYHCTRRSHSNRKHQEILKQLQDNYMFLKPTKCEFNKTKFEYLGMVIEEGKISMDPGKLKVIRDWPAPTAVKQTWGFLGFGNFYWQFIWGFSDLAKPLNDLLKKDHKFEWTDACQQTFDKLKKWFTEEPVLMMPDQTKPFQI